MKKTGLQLNREISLKVEWGNFTKKFVKLITDGFKAFNGDYLSGINAISALTGATDSIDKKIPVGARGVELILLCFAWSFDALRASGHVKEKEAKIAAKKSINLLKSKIESEKLFIPFDFFEQPSLADPYRFLRDEFVRIRGTYRPAKKESVNELKERFDSAFRTAVWDVVASRPSDFKELEELLNSPSAKTANFERQWQAYRESIYSAFHVSPVFGQEETSVSLGQLYIPLRCYWREVGNDDEKESELETHDSRYIDKNVQKSEIIHIRLIDDELDEWLVNENPGDWIRLIGGGPGSGKSTSAYAFAARLAKREELRPILVPLQRINCEGRLRDNINTYFRNRSGCPFEEGPLERKNVENGPQLVLIFDGLDEIARPGNSADEIARDMIDWIHDLHVELTGETFSQHRVLVTGRMPSFQAARRRINQNGKEALEVLGYSSLKKEGLFRRGPTIEPEAQLEGDDQLIKTDFREIWWKRYSAALGKSNKCPASLTDARLESLTEEPLLCYLLALSGYLEDNFEEAIENRNNIYSRLLKDVWKRGWGGRSGIEKKNSQKQFDVLFETMALAAWHGGDERVATIERFEKALVVMQSTEIYEDFKKLDGGDVSNLAVNFYLKKSEVEACGFEFTHKSFGEYLAAKALLTAADATADFSKTRLGAALAELLQAVADGELSNELLGFLKDEARLLKLEQAESILRALEKMMSEVVAHGFPAHNLGCETWRQAEDRQRKAESILLALIHCVANRVFADDKEASRIRINWKGDELSFGNLIHRVRRTRNRALPVLTTFSFFEAPGSCLLGQELIDSRFFGANLSDSWGLGVNLSGSDLREADLKNVLFPHAMLQESRFEKAELNEAILSNADLRYARFSEAILNGANLNETDLRGADFSKAKLVGVSLVGANLQNANFRNADLRNADLTNTDVRDANFSNANMENAIFKVAKRKGVKGIDSTLSQSQTKRSPEKGKARVRKK